MNRTPVLRKPSNTTEHGEALCIFCGKKILIDEFRDELSYKEFTISGICQKCQDDPGG